MGLTPRQLVLRFAYARAGISESRRWAGWPFVDMTWDRDLKTAGGESLATLCDKSLWRCALLHASSSGNGDEIWVIDTDTRAAWCFMCRKSETLAAFMLMPIKGTEEQLNELWSKGLLHIPDGPDVDRNAIWAQIYVSPLLAGVISADVLRREMSKNLGWLCVAFDHLRTSDMYAVEVLPAKQKQKPRTRNKKPWLDPGKRVIFMRPGERRAYAPSDSDGAGRSPTPHHRRGCWRTLRHERYARGPGGSPKKAWAKPAWVGPEEWILDGSIYRVMHDEVSPC